MSATPRFIRLLLSGRKNGYTCRTISTTRENKFFFEHDERGRYPRKSDYKQGPQTVIEQVQQGYKYLVEELRIFKEETKEKFRGDPTLINRPGEVDVQWRFDGDPEMLERWVVTADSDYGEGNSTAR